MRPNRELLKGHLPAIVLTLLAEEPLHGYALCKRIAERSGDLLRLGEGTLYPLLHRLEEQGLIESDWDRKKTPRPRKVYRVTSKGRKHLETQKTEWASLLLVLRNLLGEEWSLT